MCIKAKKQRRVDRDKRRAANEYRTSVFQTVYISICDYRVLTACFYLMKKVVNFLYTENSLDSLNSDPFEFLGYLLPFLKYNF